MRIALFNVSGRLASDGSRLISAILKRDQHDVVSVFFARPAPINYTPIEFDPLDDIIKKSDLVMVGVYSGYAIRAVQLTEYIHNKFPGLKVIWGGPHCISAPELSLDHADGVCFSEGDEVIIELVTKMESGKNYLDTPNMAFKVKDSVIINKALPPFSDLDNLPYYDYDFKDQFLLDNGLMQMTKERFKERNAGYPYYIQTLYPITSRGCPHNCSYCNNCRYINLFNSSRIRFQSIGRAIDEMSWTLERLDFMRLIMIGDDDFLARSAKDLEDFAQRYKRRIGLPLGIALSANSFNKTKLEPLLDAGLKLVQMGVQSGSERILNEVYNRRIKLSKTRDVVKQISLYRKTHDLDLLVDFIIDNPYESKDDIIKTYRYLLDLPLFIRSNLFFLAFFPGTPIYDRALADGIIEPFTYETFRFYTRSQAKYQKNYETFLILFIRYLRRSRIFVPKFLLRILGSRPVRWLASFFPASLYASLTKVLQSGPPWAESIKNNPTYNLISRR